MIQLVVQVMGEYLVPDGDVFPVLTVSFSPGRRVKADDKRPEHTEFDPWYEGHNFGYTADE